MSDDALGAPDDARTNREAQPDHAEHAAEAGGQVERLGRHQHAAGDDQGMEHESEDRGDQGREEPYDEEPMVAEEPPT